MSNTVSQVNSAVKPKRLGKLKIMALNVRNLNTKVLMIEVFLEQHKPDVLFVTEAELENGITVAYKGYNCFYSNGHKARTVAIVKASTEYSALPPPSPTGRR